MKVTNTVNAIECGRSGSGEGFRGLTTTTRRYGIKITIKIKKGRSKTRKRKIHKMVVGDGFEPSKA